MAGLVPAIHVLLSAAPKTWMPGTRPSVTVLQRVGVGLAGADAHRALDAGDENLAVADLPGLGGRGDRLDHPVDPVGRDRDLDLDLGQEADGVFGAAIDFGMAFLAAVALDIADGEAGGPDVGEGVAHLLELERLDDGDDGLHGRVSPAVTQSESSGTPVSCPDGAPRVEWAQANAKPAATLA